VRIVEVRSAMGGDDAAKFAQELTRAYLRYALRQGWECEVIEQSEKTAVLRIEGEGVELLAVEAGTHRVTRIPSNERQGRRHTSAVTVAVLPISKKADSKLGDVEIETYKGTGPGGQHRNKTETCVRVTHRESGLVALACSEKSQATNKERALEVLASRVQANAQRRLDDAHAAKRRVMH